MDVLSGGEKQRIAVRSTQNHAVTPVLYHTLVLLTRAGESQCREVLFF